MQTSAGILMVEPSGRTSVAPLIDELTRKMTAAWRKRRDSDYGMKGFHSCACHATSDNKDHWVGNDLLTNSLCIHYLAFHREDIPPEELAKVRTLTDDEAEPTEQEISRPRIPRY